jgi:hypothetical protein
VVVEMALVALYYEGDFLLHLAVLHYLVVLLVDVLKEVDLLHFLTGFLHLED